jgi:glycosyltransferase involved in cell wall biosynthesis
VVHDQGENLTRHYTAASALLLFWKNNAYLDFAVPVKLLAAIGFGIPVITTAGTEAARFVEREGIGWVVATREELGALLTRLRDDPSSVIDKRVAALAARERNSWQARARRVADVLDVYRSKKNES